MASVKRFPGSANWYACYKLATGDVSERGRPVFRRVQRSTGTTERDTALQLAISLERAARLVAEKRWVEQMGHRFLREIDAISGVPVVQIVQTEQFIQSWLAAKKRTAAPKTWRNIDGVIRDFLEWLDTRRTAPLLDITSRQIAGFRDAELAAGKASTTVNKALSFLGQLFEEAYAQGVMEKNPVRGLRVKGAEKRAQKRRHFTFEQFRGLIACTASDQKGTHGGETHPDWQTFLLITGYTGGRQQEVARLQWANVDFEKKRIGLVRTKTGGDLHCLPLHPALYEHLRRRAQSMRGSGSEYVLPGFAKIEERVLSKNFREFILPRIGISQPYAPPSEAKGRGRKLAEYSIHSLRHSLVTWLLEAGVPEILRMRIVGHEDEDVNRVYTHTDFEAARNAIEKLSSI